MRLQDKIELTDSQRKALKTLISTGTHKATVIRNAAIILKSDQNKTDDDIATFFEVHKRTVIRTRQRFLKYVVDESEPLETALGHRPRKGAPKHFDEKVEATVIAMACTTPPDGHVHWNLKLLGEHVSLEIAKPISRETVRRMLKKTNYSHIAKSNGAFPK